MAKYKITLKRDAALSSDADGMKTAGIEAATKEVTVFCRWCTEAVVSATKSNYGFYPIAWECIEQDKKTPEELAEEAENKKILDEYYKKQAEKKAAEEKANQVVSQRKQN